MSFSFSLVDRISEMETTLKPSAGNVSEEYELCIYTNGSVIITAQTSLGVIHALTTTVQLVYAHSGGGQYIPNAPVLIKDTPAFGHRGLNLDVSRNPFSIGTVLKVVDALSWNKMNRLHLHATGMPIYIHSSNLRCAIMAS